MELWQKLALIVGGWGLLTWLLSRVAAVLGGERHPLAATARALRNLLLPLALLLLLGIHVFEWSEAGSPRRILETLLWIAVIAVALSLVKNTALRYRDGGQYQTRFPKLLLDILRLLMVAVGACIVIANVWGADLGGLLTAVGVSTIVLGLALQNTLDNVMAGI